MNDSNSVPPDDRFIITCETYSRQSGAGVMGIVWIASYPKSGNTWMRFLLANYFAGPIQQSEQVETLIPGISDAEQVDALLKTRGRVFGKTHLPWGPRLPRVDQTERSVVVVRHPKDVLLSNLNYHRLAPGNERAFTDRAYAMAFIAHGCDPRWKHVGYGTLDQNVRSWIDAGDNPPRLIVRYEDLKTDTAREFKRTLEFLGLPVDDKQVQMAVQNSSFDQMRAMEVRDKQAGSNLGVFPGPPPRVGSPRYFMNQGRIGAKLAKISPDLDAIFDRKFAPLLSLLGYT